MRAHFSEITRAAVTRNGFSEKFLKRYLQYFFIENGLKNLKYFSYMIQVTVVFHRLSAHRLSGFINFKKHPQIVRFRKSFRNTVIFDKFVFKNSENINIFGLILMLICSSETNYATFLSKNEFIHLKGQNFTKITLLSI